MAPSRHLSSAAGCVYRAPGKLRHFRRSASRAQRGRAQEPPARTGGRRSCSGAPRWVAPNLLRARCNSTDLERQATHLPASLSGPAPPPTRAPDLGVTTAGARGCHEQVWVHPGRPPPRPRRFLTKAKSSDPTGEPLVKEKAKINTYHCCSKSQSLKKSNRSIAAGRRRRRRAAVPARCGSARLRLARLAGCPGRPCSPALHSG